MIGLAYPTSDRDAIMSASTKLHRSPKESRDYWEGFRMKWMLAKHLTNADYVRSWSALVYEVCLLKRIGPLINIRKGKRKRYGLLPSFLKNGIIFWGRK